MQKYTYLRNYPYFCGHNLGNAYVECRDGHPQNIIQNLSPTFSLFLMVGFCGGFTTFSTFSKEGLTLLQTNHLVLFLLYTLGSVVLGVLAVALGYITTK